MKVNMFGFLLSPVGWSGDQPRDAEGLPAKEGDKNDNDVNALFDLLSNPQKGNIGLLRNLAEKNGIPTTVEILDNPALFKQKVVDDTSSTLYNFIKIQSDI